MCVRASAPGKLVLLGEYAVLEGAPALVLAVNRRATATFTPLSGGVWKIVSPTLALRAQVRIGAGQATRVEAAPPELAWIGILLSRFPHVERLPNCRLELDSDAFHLDAARGWIKLGLGSSAALAVAVLGGLHVLAETPPPTLIEAIAAHRAIQHGRGSGIDIAASLAGGLSHYQLASGRAQRDTLAFPSGLHWCCAFTGRATSTGAMLATVAAWRTRHPGPYGHWMAELASISGRGIDAIRTGDAVAFMSSVGDYTQTLARFGNAAGADIASREHRALGGIASDCGCVYKSCGAGGGDVGITFAVEDSRLREFGSRAEHAGFTVIELEADPKGLEVVSTA